MNSQFQTQLQNDLAKVFLNLEEFAETHNVEGIGEVACVVDTDSTQALRPGLNRYDGTFKETIMLFIRESDVISLPNQPAYNQQIILDKNRYRIKQVDLYNGLYEMILEAVK
jgi:hypothetical protein